MLYLCYYNVMDNSLSLEYKNIKLKKTTAIARQILFYFLDVNRNILPMFDKRNVYRIPFQYYDRFRDQDKDRFNQELYRLEQAGFIKKYLDGKEEIIELKPKGKNRIKRMLTQDLEIPIPKKWDRKWRLVIYDIANDNKDKRQFLKNKLENLGFIKLQESVYIFPFDCLREITLLKNMYFLNPHVQFIIADRVETETNLIKIFLDRGILKKSI